MSFAHATLPAVFTDTIYAVCFATPAAFSAAGFAGSGMDYTVIGAVESFPVIGSKRDSTEFASIRGARIQCKGAPDYGGGDIVMADTPSDAGQIILRAVEATPDPCSIKVTYPDGEVHYFWGHILSWQLTPGSEGAYMKRVSEFQANAAPVVVRASEYLLGEESGTGPLLMQSGERFEVSP